MHISIAAEKLFQLGWLPVTNTVLTTWLAIVLLFIFSLLATRRLRLVPQGLQNFAEIIIEQCLSFMESVTGDKNKARKFFPLVATIFIFVLTVNWMGLLPGFGTIGIVRQIHQEKEFLPLFRGASADLNTTIALSVISIVVVQVVGIVSIGFFKYLKKFIRIKNPLRKPFSVKNIFFDLIDFGVGILEFVSEVSKILSFSFRLFGNIFAGEVLLIVMSTLAPILIPIPFFLLEVFVGFIQAVVFAMLTLVFLQMATIEAH